MKRDEIMVLHYQRFRRAWVIWFCDRVSMTVFAVWMLRE
jgi:hypothetical protein